MQDGWHIAHGMHPVDLVLVQNDAKSFLDRQDESLD
jgi:hypothetical protein